MMRRGRDEKKRSERNASKARKPWTKTNPVLPIKVQKKRVKPIADFNRLLFIAVYV